MTISHNDASELFDKARAAYREFSTYQDSGYSIIRRRGEEERIRTKFETLFVAPNRFRFRFESGHPYEPLRHIITRQECGFDGECAYFWMKHHESPPQIEVFESVEIAVAAATGVSDGAAHTIGQLLQLGISGGLMQLTDLHVIGEAEVDGNVCVEVRGTPERAVLHTSVFIDPNALLIRKVSTRFESFTTDEYRTNVRLNAPIDHSHFVRPIAHLRIFDSTGK
jgi:hypothetical protein